MGLEEEKFYRIYCDIDGCDEIYDGQPDDTPQHLSVCAHIDGWVNDGEKWFCPEHAKEGE